MLRRQVTLAVVMLGCVAAGVLHLHSGGRAGEACATLPPPQAPVVVVAPGETLWMIAARHAPEDLDLRLAVHSIRSLNGLDSALLRVGQRLRLPAGWPTPR